MKNLILKVLLLSVCWIQSVGFASVYSEEVKTRFMTERLTSEEKVQMIQEQIKDLDLYDRILFYADIYKNLNLKEQGVNQKGIDQLFMDVLTDLERVPRGMFTPSSTCEIEYQPHYSLGCLSNQMLEKALTGNEMSQQVAHQFLTRMFDTLWVDGYIGGHFDFLTSGFITKKQVPSDRYRLVMGQLIHKRIGFSNVEKEAEITGHRLMQLYTQRVNTAKTGFFNLVSYQDRLWTYQEMLKAGQIKSLDFKFRGEESESSKLTVRDLAKRLELSAKFESAIQASSRVEDGIMVLQDLAKQPENIVYISDAVTVWLMQSPLSENQMDRALSIISASYATTKNSKNAGFQEMRSSAIDQLHGLMYKIQLSEKAQMMVMNLMLQGSERERYMVRSNAFEYKPEDAKTKIEVLQKALESVAELSNEADAQTHYKDDADLNYTNIGGLMSSLRSCEGKKDGYPGVRMAGCDSLKSTKVIYLKIANNPKLPKILKDKAAVYAIEAAN